MTINCALKFSWFLLNWLGLATTLLTLNKPRSDIAKTTVSWRVGSRPVSQTFQEARSNGRSHVRRWNKIIIYGSGNLKRRVVDCVINRIIRDFRFHTHLSHNPGHSACWEQGTLVPRLKIDMTTRAVATCKWNYGLEIIKWNNCFLLLAFDLKNEWKRLSSKDVLKVR